MARLPKPRSNAEIYLGAVLDELKGLRADLSGPPQPEPDPDGGPQPVTLEEPDRSGSEHPAKRTAAKKATSRKS